MDQDKKDKKHKEPDLFATIDGLKPVDPNSLREFEQTMNEVIPEIVEAVEERRSLAAKGRRWQLKH